MRQEAANLLGSSVEHLITVYSPFSFTAKDGNGEEIRSAHILYVHNLWRKTEDMLDANDITETGYMFKVNCTYSILLRVHCLTWHEGMPKDEVWC